MGGIVETSLKVLLDEIHQLEKAVSEQLKKKENDFLYSVKNRSVIFEADVRKKHQHLKKSIHRFLIDSSLLSLLVSPVIYSMLIPAVLLDGFASIYQLVCFPVYGIPKVKRRDYIVLDRHKLRYLNLIERLNCDYCAYFNGVIAFVREIASRTELYFCPIRHALTAKGQHARHAEFLPFGDSENYHEKLNMIREQLRRAECTPAPPSSDTTACGEPKK